MNVVLRADSESAAVDESRFMPATQQEHRDHWRFWMTWHDLPQPSDEVLDGMIERLPKMMVPA